MITRTITMVIRGVDPKGGGDPEEIYLDDDIDNANVLMETGIHKHTQRERETHTMRDMTHCCCCGCQPWERLNNMIVYTWPDLLHHSPPFSLLLFFDALIIDIDRYFNDLSHMDGSSILTITDITKFKSCLVYNDTSK